MLPHQLRQLAGQVHEVQLVLNLGPSGIWPDPLQRRQIARVLESATEAWPHAHVREVDYSAEARKQVAERFYGGRPVPLSNHDGGPFYSYWYGWHAARNNHVLHADSDMFFGGGSQTWVCEALSLLQSRPDVLAVSPLAGPPTLDGELPESVRQRHARWGSAPVRERHASVAYAIHGVSTRVWLFDRLDLVARVGPIPLERPPLRSQARGLLEGHPPYELPEKVLSGIMRRCGLWRIDMLGTGKGLWTLHPALRSETFYELVPKLVERVESGEVPDAQRGDYDINDSLVDWSSARAALRHKAWWRRTARAALRPLAQS